MELKVIVHYFTMSILPDKYIDAQHNAVNPPYYKGKKTRRNKQLNWHYIREGMVLPTCRTGFIGIWIGFIRVRTVCLLSAGRVIPSLSAFF